MATIQDQNHELEDESNSNRSIDSPDERLEEKNCETQETAALEAAAPNVDEDDEEGGNKDEEDLEEGELKDDDDDDDDEEEDNENNVLNDDTKRLTGFNNNIYDNSTNSGFSKESSSQNDNRHDTHQHHQNPHHQNYPPHHNNNPSAGPPQMYARGPPPAAGPMHKVRCRFYSKTSNKCTWGDACRFEHRDDSPESDTRPPPPQMAPGVRGPPPPMGGALDRGQYPPYPGRHQPYPPPPPPHGFPYDAYGHHHSTPPPLPPPPHAGYHWAPPIGGAPSPSYPSPSSSAVVYERKHRLAYEVAPWNDRGHPPPSTRGDPAAYPGGRGFYRNHYSSREPPYGREPVPHMGGPYPGYQYNPSAYRGSPMGPHASHYKYMSSSQRNVPVDSRRRSNKRGHDEDESSWSDSGSEDSILGQASYKSHPTKVSKQQPPENPTSEEPIDQGGSGTPPGEPLHEDRERQAMLLNKLKEIEETLQQVKREKAKKGEQEDNVE